MGAHSSVPDMVYMVVNALRRRPQTPAQQTWSKSRTIHHERTKEQL